MDCPPIPLFCLNFLLRSKTFEIADRYILSSKPENVVRLVYTHYKVQITLLHSGLH